VMVIMSSWMRRTGAWSFCERRSELQAKSRHRLEMLVLLAFSSSAAAPGSGRQRIAPVRLGREDASVEALRIVQDLAVRNQVPDSVDRNDE
jgi:hypothetical protein